jgi:polysaccharide export outer membrane protein
VLNRDQQAIAEPALAPSPRTTPPRHRLVAAALAALAILQLAACGGPRRFVWVEEMPRSLPAEKGEYVIGPGDLLSIRVHGQDSITSTVRVRDDGRISLPLVADPVAAGVSPSTLAELLEAQLKTYVNRPVVTVSLEERRPTEVSVLGQVTLPGVYRVAFGGGVLKALALAGGLTARADRDAVYVIRVPEHGGPPERIRFRYASLLQSEGPSSTFQLKDSDVVLVE